MSRFVVGCVGGIVSWQKAMRKKKANNMPETLETCEKAL